jgi:hypothetical protein
MIVRIEIKIELQLIKTYVKQKTQSMVRIDLVSILMDFKSLLLIPVL